MNTRNYTALQFSVGPFSGSSFDSDRVIAIGLNDHRCGAVAILKHGAQFRGFFVVTWKDVANGPGECGGALWLIGQTNKFVATYSWITWWAPRVGPWTSALRSTVKQRTGRWGKGRHGRRRPSYLRHRAPRASFLTGDRTRATCVRNVSCKTISCATGLCIRVSPSSVVTDAFRLRQVATRNHFLFGHDNLQRVLWIMHIPCRKEMARERGRCVVRLRLIIIIINNNKAIKVDRALSDRVSLGIFWSCRC